MDRVGGLGAPQPFLPRKDDGSARKGRKASGTEKTGFLGFLTRAETPAADLEGGPTGIGQASEESLEKLLDEVYAAGQELARNPSPENILIYKKAVGLFIRQVVDGSVQVVESEGRMRKDMKRPKYALLHVVDEKLDKLGAYVLQNQKDRLEILRKVDELHGLLVDLKH